MFDEYFKIITDESFNRCIAIRAASEFTSDYCKELIKHYKIPIPSAPQQCWTFNDVRPIVLRLREIAEDIDFRQDKYGGYSVDAIRFHELIEALAGKRFAHKLAYLALQCDI